MIKVHIFGNGMYLKTLLSVLLFVKAMNVVWNVFQSAMMVLKWQLEAGILILKFGMLHLKIQKAVNLLVND
uniref:Putative secreted protein n=1 Tax=Xenopsylla cheopis TaxID=163159 RepID=A0A6M2E0V4_XENCH